MKTKAIFVNAYSRPQYLRVCLEAISRCASLSDWDIWVSIDGGSPANFSVCRSIFQHYQINRPRNLGPRDHPTEILRSALELGYEKILYMEDDSILATDVLTYVDTQPDQGEFVSCHWVEGQTRLLWYISNSPVLLHAPLIRRILSLMDTKGYAGLPNPLIPGDKLTAACPAHDSCWAAWAIANSVHSRLAHRQMTLNFGFCGVDWKHKDLQDRAFAGPPESWFNEVLKIGETSAAIMGTPGFVYK